MEDIVIPSLDEYPLAATHFVGANPDGPVVMLANGVAVPRRFYRHFAEWLGEQGASHVYSFDYRGIGGSIISPDNSKFKPYDYVMSDWARSDFTGVISWIKKKHPDHPFYFVGHSFGGQALGLSNQNHHIERALLIASMSGYWARMASPERYRVFIMLAILAPLMGKIFGYVPGKLGLGEDVSHGAMAQWGRWCRSQNYFFDDPAMPDVKNFTNVKAPMLAVGIEDDPWARPELIDNLVNNYTGANLERRQFSNEEAGGPVGHFNFFKPKHREKLWNPVGEWLLG